MLSIYRLEKRAVKKGKEVCFPFSFFMLCVFFCVNANEAVHPQFNKQVGNCVRTLRCSTFSASIVFHYNVSEFNDVPCVLFCLSVLFLFHYIRGSVQRRCAKYFHQSTFPTTITCQKKQKPTESSVRKEFSPLFLIFFFLIHLEYHSFPL